MVSVNVIESSRVAEARRAAGDLARSIGFGEEDAGNLALVTTELATNLVNHARDGWLIVRALERGGVTGIEVLSLDRGPGIPDVAASMRDGHSTRGGPGTGLGAIRRLATEFDIYSSPGQGTAIVVRHWPRRSLPAPAPITIGAVCQPKPSETVPGDHWGFRVDGDRCLVVMADGLGHGPDAARAARTAVGVLWRRTDAGPGELCHAIHRELAPTRGAAVAVAAISMSRREVTFAGVGNITAVVSGPERSYRMVSHNGTAGHVMPRVQEFKAAWPRQALLILHSDGLTSRWDLSTSPGLAQKDPSLVAGVLFRDHARGTDDATVVVARLEGSAE